MKPLFNEGDIVLVASLRFQTSSLSPHSSSFSFKFLTFSLWPSAFGLNLGDCVVYNFNGQNLLHRIVGFDDNGVWGQDDAGVTEKHFVKFENISGKVITKNPFKKGLLGYFYFKMKKFIK